MSKILKKYFDQNSTAVPIFHGSSCEIHPEDFDFSMAVPESDFGKAAYFGLNYDQAKKNGPTEMRRELSTGTSSCSMTHSTTQMFKYSFLKMR